MRIALFFAVALLMSSCSTIMSGTYTRVNVFTRPDSIPIRINNDTVVTYSPVQIQVKRSNAPLHLRFGQDSGKSLWIPAKTSLMFWLGNVLNGTMPIGHLIDLSNDKRFTYPEFIMIDVDNNLKPNFKYKTRVMPENFRSLKSKRSVEERFGMKKGDLRIKFSVPESNSFVLKKENGVGNSFGFLGITTGVDFLYKDNFFFGAGIGTLTDFLAPFPAPFDFMGEHEKSFGSYIDLVHGFGWKRFSFSYGLSLSRTTFQKWNTVELFPLYRSYLEYSKVEARWGLSASAVYKFADYFNIGVKYIPTFKTMNTSEFRYGHFLFLDIAFNYRFRLLNK